MRILSSKAHTIIGLLIGLLLLFAPQLFNFSDNGPATSTAIGVGIFILLSELVTTSPLGILKLIPMRIHLVLDYITGAFLALTPWLFGFAGSGANVWVPHLIVGILVICYALITNPAVDAKESATSAAS